MITIEEAIRHAKEVAEEKQKQADSNIQFVKDNIQYLYDGKKYRECCECAKEHRQLALWLEELKRHREAWQNVIDEINKEKEDAMFKPDSDFYDGVFYALGFALGVIDKELEKVV